MRICKNCGADIAVWQEVFAEDVDKGNHVCFPRVAMPVLRMEGKAREVFRLLKMLTRRKGHRTLKELKEEW